MNINKLLKHLSYTSLEWQDNYIVKLKPNLYHACIDGEILELAFSEVKLYLKLYFDNFKDINLVDSDNSELNTNQVELFNVDNFGNELEFYKNKTREVVQSKFNNFVSNIYQLANNLCNFLESNNILPVPENKTTLKVNGKLRSITSQQSILLALLDVKKAISINYPSAQIKPIYSAGKCNLKAKNNFNIALYKDLINRYRCT